MNKVLLALSCLVFAGCAAKKAIMIPMRHPAKVAIPGSIRTLMFENVTESRGAVPGGYKQDGDDNVTLVKATLSAEFCASSYAVLNDELLEMVRKTGKIPNYLRDGPTVAADFLNQMIGDPGSIGVVEVDVTSAFGDAYTVRKTEVALTTMHYDQNGVGAPRVATRSIPIHRIDVFGAVTAVVRIRTPYPDGKVVFEKTYTVPEFRYASTESAPRSLFLFGRSDAAKQGNGAPTLTEVKAIQFKQLARMFYEDISPSTSEVPGELDNRGDKMAYNLLAEGALPWAEVRLRKVGKEGKPVEQAANLYNLGVCWEAQGMSSEAVVKYKAALDMEPGNGRFRKAHERASAQSK
ncbi:MAG: tetratricopeptide repeat protein [Planctomycetota bacterium]